jgi:hypothetical protein
MIHRPKCRTGSSGPSTGHPHLAWSQARRLHSRGVRSFKEEGQTTWASACRVLALRCRSAVNTGLPVPGHAGWSRLAKTREREHDLALATRRRLAVRARRRSRREYRAASIIVLSMSAVANAEPASARDDTQEADSTDPRSRFGVCPASVYNLTYFHLVGADRAYLSRRPGCSPGLSRVRTFLVDLAPAPELHRWSYVDPDRSRRSSADDGVLHWPARS